MSFPTVGTAVPDWRLQVACSSVDALWSEVEAHLIIRQPVCFVFCPIECANMSLSRDCAHSSEVII